MTYNLIDMDFFFNMNREYELPKGYTCILQCEISIKMYWEERKREIGNYQIKALSTETFYGQQK